MGDGATDSLMRHTEIALQRPVTTVVTFVALALVGLIASRLLPLEKFPRRSYRIGFRCEDRLFVARLDDTALLCLHNNGIAASVRKILPYGSRAPGLQRQGSARGTA